MPEVKAMSRAIINRAYFEPPFASKNELAAPQKHNCCMKALRSLQITAFMALWAIALPAQQKPIDLHQASHFFAEMKAASDRDAGRLWGHRLYGPMLFVDPETRFAVANQQDRENKLTAQGDVFTGTVPPELGVANTAVDWAGITWTMILWPLPEYRWERTSLMAHECFHRIQPALGIQPKGDILNGQLDARDGRIWLQLEFRALASALWSTGVERTRAIADALYFRAYRRSLFPGSAERENALEINEGLAEYTGVTIASRSNGEAMSRDETALQLAPQKRSFVRSFAYITGPAYGFLLDQSGQPWRPKIRANSDLSQLLAVAYHISVPPVTNAGALRREQAYNGDEIITLENDRAELREKAIADAKARLIDGPVLILPLGPNVQYTFNPNALMAIDDNTTVYPSTQITDEWGVLQVDNGALLVRDKGHLVRAQVPAPKDADSREGDGWKLDLKPGWKLEPGQRSGDWAVVKKPNN